MENKALKEAFKELHEDIIKDVNPDHAMDVLLAKNIITDDDYDELRHVARTKNRCRDLLSLLRGCTHPETFIHLRDALQGDYPWIVEKIDEQLTPQTDQLQQLHLGHSIDGNFL